MCNDKCGCDVKAGQACSASESTPERTLLSTTDARVWAREFLAVFSLRDYVDEYTLTTWFANAIEMGRDSALNAARAQDESSDHPESEDLSGLHFYRAWSSPGTPVCVGSDIADSDLEVIIYDDESGSIRGVKVAQGSTLLAATGEFPIMAINEEREYLGLAPLDVEPWLSATAIGE